MSIGKGWFAAVVGVLFGIYGAVELIVHSKTTGWAWIAGGLGTMLLVSLNVAHRALRARNAALRGEPGHSLVVFNGGDHHHHHHYDGEAPHLPGSPETPSAPMRKEVGDANQCPNQGLPGTASRPGKD